MKRDLSDAELANSASCENCPGQCTKKACQAVKDAGKCKVASRGPNTASYDALMALFKAHGIETVDVTPKPALVVTLPIRTVSEANMREHWGKKYARKRSQQRTVALFLGNKTPPPPPLEITLTRIAQKKLDSDNLAGSFKHVQDGIAAWFGIDDGDNRLHWHYRQRPCKPREYAVEVHIEQEAVT